MAVVGLALFATSACTQASQDPDVAPSQPTTASSAPGLPAWKPKKPISHPTMSEEQKVKLRKKLLKNMAKELTTKPPEVELVRWTTVDNYITTWVQCLNDAGWDAHANADSGIVYPPGFDSSQMSAFQYDLYVCRAKYTRDPKYIQPFTKDQLGLIYDYDVEWLVPCLALHGYKATESPPTRDTFIATTGQWDPYEAAHAFGAKNFDQLVTECPRRPPSEYLYG